MHWLKQHITDKPGFGARPTEICIFERQNHAATSEVISQPTASGTL
ncbi:MAG TPA: hypothetical protein VF411_03660 [Bacteroidia bacterium]